MSNLEEKCCGSCVNLEIPWKEPEIVEETPEEEIDDFLHNWVFNRLPLPSSVKDRMIELVALGGKLEDACDEPLTDEEKNKILNSKYIDDTLALVQETPTPPCL